MAKVGLIGCTLNEAVVDEIDIPLSENESGTVPCDKSTTDNKNAQALQSRHRYYCLNFGCKHHTNYTKERAG